MTSETIQRPKPPETATDKRTTEAARSMPAPTPQEFFRRLTERPEMRELLRRLSKR
jgi:hypothetical protein